MFYSVQLLGKTSPLGKLWLAAHADKRLKRQDINSTDVPQSVEQIIHSEDSENQVPLALRLSGLLLLGLVKIYSRQLQYLQEDCLTAVQELDKADKVAGVWKGQKQQKKNAKATVANQADVTVPDEPHQLFRFSSLSDEEGFGLFEENHAGLAMAAEAHASFMDLEFSLSQSDAHDDSAMVNLDEPEQLRAVPEDFDHDVEPALPFGDELPRMTPTKRIGRSASRDKSPEAMETAHPELDPMGMEALPDANNGMLEAPLPIDDLPDLPSMVRPSDVRVSDSATQNDAQPGVEMQTAQHGSEDRVIHDEQREQPEIDHMPDDVQDHAPDPTPDVQPSPDAEPGLESGLRDEPMKDAPGMPSDADNVNAIVSDNHAEAAKADDVTNDDQQQVENSLQFPKRSQGKRIRSDPASAVPKQPRKRSTAKPRADADKQSTIIASEETRELLKNRTSLICKLPPIVGKPRLLSRQLNTDDLDILLVPSAVQEASLDQRMVRLFEAIGSCRPLSIHALRGDDDSTGTDEIEDQIPALEVPSLRPKLPSTDADEHVEVLRDAQPSVSGSHGMSPVSDPKRSLEADEREQLEGDGNFNMQTDDAADMELPAMELPEGDVPELASADMSAPAMPTTDVQRMDVPTAEMPSPDMPPPHMPTTDMPSEMQQDRTDRSSAELDGVDNIPPGQSSRFQSQSTDALHHEHTPVETLYSAPATQGTGGAEDSSLNAHTLHTLERLERLSQGLPDSRKRKQPQVISMAQLVQSTNRPEGAKLFYDVLVLQAKGIIRLQEQESPYAGLEIVLNFGQDYN